MKFLNRQWLLSEGLRVVRFLAVGCSGLATDTVVFSVLDGQDVERAVSRALSLGCATLVTWSINRQVTFTKSGRRRREELGRYALVALVAQGFNYLTFLGLVSIFPLMAPVIFIVLCSAAAAVLSYSGQRFFTFSPAAQAAPIERTSSAN